MEEIINLNLFDKKGKELKIGDKIRIFRVGHPEFETFIYYGQSAIREDCFGRCLWDYSLRNNIINCIKLE